jgi:hypothetical protein
LIIRLYKDREDRVRDGEVLIRVLVLVWVRKLRRARAGSGLVLDGLIAFVVVEVELARKICFSAGVYGRINGWMGGVLDFFAFERGRCMI